MKAHRVIQQINKLIEYAEIQDYTFMIEALKLIKKWEKIDMYERLFIISPN